MLILVYLSFGYHGQAQADPPIGIVVLEVKKSSATDAIGLEAGDLILSWKLNSETKEQSLQGWLPIMSVFDWLYLRREHAHQGTIILKIRRGKKIRHCQSAHGFQAVTVCPIMKKKDLRFIQNMQVDVRQENYPEFLKRIERIAGQFKKKGQRENACWMRLFTALKLADIRQYDCALQQLDSGLALAENLSNREIAYQFMSTMATLWNNQNRPDLAEALYKEILEHESGQADENLRRASCWLALAVLSVKTGDSPSALEYFNKAVNTALKLAPTSLFLAAIYHEFGFYYQASGDLNSAEQLYNKALSIRMGRDVVGTEIAKSYSSLGMIYLKRGDLVTSEEFQLKALELIEQCEPESMIRAIYLNNLGLVYLKRSELERARTSFEKSLSIKEKWSLQSLDTVSTLSNLGSVALDQGDLESAQTYLEKGIKIADLVAPESMLTSHILNTYAAVLYELGEIAESGVYLEKSTEIKRRLAPDSLGLATNLNNLGVFHADMGNQKRAEASLREALEIRKRHAPDDIVVAYSYYSLGNLLMDRGAFGEAERYFKKALEFLNQYYPDHLLSADVNFNLGVLHYYYHDHVSARAFFERAFSLYQKISPDSLDMADFYLSVAAIELEMNELSAPEEKLKKALSICMKRAPHSPRIATIQNHLITLHLARRKYETAESMLRKNLLYFQDQNLMTLDYGISFLLYGDLERQRAHILEAEKKYAKALEIFHLIAPGSQFEAQAFHSLGSLYLESGNLQAAHDNLKNAVMALEQQKDHLEGKNELLEKFSKIYADYYRELIDVQLKLNLQSEAFSTLERFKATSLLMMLAEKDLYLESDIPVELVDERNRLAVKYRVLLDELIKGQSPNDDDRIRQIRDSIVTVKQRLQEIKSQIKKTSPRYAALKYPEPVDLNQALPFFPSGTAGVFYSLGKGMLHIMLVQSNELIVHSTKLEQDVLKQTIVRLRNLAANPDSNLDLIKKQGKILYDFLIKPIEQFIAGTPELILCPDGPLYQLAFALLSPDGDSWLVEKKAIRSIISTTILRETKNIAITQKDRLRFLAFGDPIYPEVQDLDGNEAIPTIRLGRSLSLTSLPWTRTEVNVIGSLFQGESRIFLGPEANESRVREWSNEGRLVHFACHALIDELFPLNSGLVLSVGEKVGNESEDGFLQAWEIIEYLRLQAELVVLSACQTGLGQEMGGEGIIGLTRAFHYAGARNVISTYWNIADISTSLFMKKFYFYYSQGNTFSVSLAATQKDFIQDPNQLSDGLSEDQKTYLSSMNHPFFWAGFVLSGAN